MCCFNLPSLLYPPFLSSHPSSFSDPCPRHFRLSIVHFLQSLPLTSPVSHIHAIIVFSVSDVDDSSSGATVHVYARRFSFNGTHHDDVIRCRFSAPTAAAAAAAASTRRTKFALSSDLQAPPFYSSTADRRRRRRRRRLILCLSESRSIPAAVLPRLDYCNAVSRDGRTLCKANSSTAGHLSFHVSFTRLILTGFREYDAFGSKRRSSGKLTYLVRTLTISDDI